MKLEVSQVFHGTIKNLCIDNDTMYIQNDNITAVNCEDFSTLEVKEANPDDFLVVQNVFYMLYNNILHREAVELCSCSMFTVKPNQLKQHIVYSYFESILHRITISQSLSMMREQFDIQILEFHVLNDDTLLIQSTKNLAIYNYGNEQPILIINDYKLSLPLLGAYKYKYVIDIGEYLYLARYKGTCIYSDKKEIVISNNLPFSASGFIIGGFLYTVEHNTLKVIHLYSLDTATYDINGILFKTSKGAFLYANSCLYKIAVRDYSNIQQIMCGADLYPMALDSLKSNPHSLDLVNQSIYIKKRWIKYLLNKQQYEETCQLMMDIDYPLSEFLSQFPEIVPSQLDLSSLDIFNFPNGGTISASHIYPFLPYLSSKRAKYPIIDTIMFYIYSVINKSLLGSLIRVENSCDLDICGSILINMQMIPTWILFYSSKNANSKAFEIMISNKFEPKYFLEYFDLLVQNNQIDWLLDHVTYFLEEFKDLEFFINHRFLQSVDVQTRLFDLLSFDMYLQRDYLQEIVFKKSANQQFHTKLIQCQISIIKHIQETLSLEDDAVLQQRLILREYLTKSTDYDGNILIALLDELLLDFEVALVYKTLQRHEDALKIYILKMKNYSEAEKYCFDVYYNANQINVYANLFHIIEQYEPNKVLEFIKEYAEYLDPLTVLESIPESTKLCDLLEYVDYGMKNYLKQFQRASLLKNQLNVQHSRLQQESYYELSQSVSVDAYKVCFHCNRRIGDKACYMFEKNICCANCIKE